MILGTIAAMALMAGVADAKPIASAEKSGFDKHRTEIGFGMLVGGYSVGKVGGAGVGMHFDVGRQMGPLRLYGEYNFLSIGESSADSEDPIRGMLHRAGIAARYNLAEFGGGRYKPLQGAFWAELGAGRQHVAWDEGGILRRDDVAFGFGAQFNFRIGRDSQKPKYFGFYYAFKAFAAKSPGAELDLPATCGGPCDEATSPSPYDVGLFFNMGLNFGR